jgi:hypothetical protein
VAGTARVLADAVRTYRIWRVMVDASPNRGGSPVLYYPYETARIERELRLAAAERNRSMRVGRSRRSDRRRRSGRVTSNPGRRPGRR